NEYPFIVSDEGARALAAYIGRLKSTMLSAGAACEEEAANLGVGPRTGQPTGAQLLRPYEEIDMDGHKGGFYVVLKIRGRNNQWLYTTPLRIWLILMIDRASRAILGYSYRLGGTNYSATDVLKCVAHTLTPWAAKDLTLPNLSYKTGAGFPSSCTPLG